MEKKEKKEGKKIKVGYKQANTDGPLTLEPWQNSVVCELLSAWG